MLISCEIILYECLDLPNCKLCAGLRLTSLPKLIKMWIFSWEINKSFMGKNIKDLFNEQSK